MTTRQAFEEWVGKGLHLERIPTGAPFAGDYRSIVMQTRWDAWKAATEAALERAAEICDRAEVFAWEQWKATGNLHTEGVSDGAASLARDIRALKESKE